MHSAAVAKTTLITIALAVMAALMFLFVHVNRLESQVAALQHDVGRSHDVMLSEMTKVRDLSSMMATTNRRTLKSIREELDTARHDVQDSAGRSRAEAQANVDRLAKELRGEEQRQKDVQERVQRQLADARQAAASADARILDVRSEVGSVKSDVAQTRTALDQTVTDLRRVMGDMGVISGHIATNRKELEILRRSGERDYTEFRLSKAKDARMVNGVALLLKKTDPAAGRFTLEVLTDDVKVQKKDRMLNEPVQFYVARNKVPYEIVVNAVSKNEIAGYLATPKALGQ